MERAHDSGELGFEGCSENMGDAVVPCTVGVEIVDQGPTTAGGEGFAQRR